MIGSSLLLILSSFPPSHFHFVILLDFFLQNEKKPLKYLQNM